MLALLGADITFEQAADTPRPRRGGQDIIDAFAAAPQARILDDRDLEGG